MQTIWRLAAAIPKAIIIDTISTSDITAFTTTVISKMPALLCLKLSLQCQSGGSIACIIIKSTT